jgi:hypothetical protein
MREVMLGEATNQIGSFSGRPIRSSLDKGRNEMKKCLKSTMNLNYYACALHGIMNLNSYAYYLTINLLDSKVTSNLPSNI